MMFFIIIVATKINDGSRGNQVGKSQNVTSQTSLAKE